MSRYFLKTKNIFAFTGIQFSFGTELHTRTFIISYMLYFKYLEVLA